ncbi:hypothetical protein [Sandaracinus amylolyticus]|uniref:hypothetical protein n=1 Tax=Sandaracinus amylolyticus TaxID=927083 RepID=UPI001F4029EF|nr:hypothetical protein [Sandaracinus amylolyticus]UJR85771.1 Hypothetical protein I5071_78510 [Sandaracinus amylolyticus]
MARLTYGQKAKRVLVFLLALRNRSIASSLARYGFDDAELKLGWEHLSNLSRGRLDVVTTASPKLVNDVDAFENEWFPVVGATLQHKHPDAHELVFRNLSQATGAGAVINVRTFLERLERLPKSKTEGGLGREGKVAMDLLAKRGLTPDVIAPVKKTLDRIAQIEPATAAPERNAEQDAIAEREMWEWYLQWSAIARIAVKERRLLKLMGFLQTSAGVVVDPELEEEEDEEDGGESDEDGGEEEEKPVTPAA